jgi:hypothetical protein
MAAEVSAPSLALVLRALASCGAVAMDVTSAGEAVEGPEPPDGTSKSGLCVCVSAPRLENDGVGAVPTGTNAAEVPTGVKPGGSSGGQQLASTPKRKGRGVSGGAPAPGSRGG